MITFDDFSKLELRIGTILEAQSHPDADKLLLLKVNIGEREIQLVAGIKESYAPEELPGKQIAVLANLEPRKIRGVFSQGMILAAQGKDGISLLVSDKGVEPGSTIR